MNEEFGLELGSDEYINDQLIWGSDNKDSEETCDVCEKALVRGECPTCVNCEFCDELTDNDPDEDDRFLCGRCSEGCGTCGYKPCACDAIYDAWRDRF